MKRLVGLLFFLIGLGFVVREIRASKILGADYKYSFVLADSTGGVKYISFDPQEKKIFTLEYPTNLEIKSRSVGVYTVGKLYTLGSYEGNPGEFVRKKVQGFMRAPVPGYLVSDLPLSKALFRAIIRNDQTTLTRLDASVLYWRSKSYVSEVEDTEDLVREGVIELVEDKYVYKSERLQQFLSVRVFDWEIGEEGVTAAVINRSGEDGLGRDLAQFLTNAGVDVVSVRGAEEVNEETKVTIASGDEKAKELFTTLSDWFSWYQYEEGETTSTRSRMIIYVGRDALKLF